MASVPDRALAARLARGLYATPGRYPATVRFANADSNINADLKADVRAMSFAVEPAGRQRQDFSTNDRTTFPINDAHAFATTVKVVTAPTMGAGLWALPFRDKLSFARTAVLGAEQEHQSLLPYQERRYWSTVPFSHGPTDVIKYSLTPCVGNPAADLEDYDPNTLQDELVRHLEADTAMSCFDFGLQLLDTAGDDLLGTAAGRELLDRERQRRVEGIAGAVSHRRAAHARRRVRSWRRRPARRGTST